MQRLNARGSMHRLHSAFCILHTVFL
jgi:hypothetical protein